MDKLVFGMHHLAISQIGTLIDGQPHYSHPNYALDLVGEDTGIDFWKNMESETCFFCAGSFGTRETGNTRFFITCDETGKATPVMCADGKERIITLAMTHSNKDYEIYKIYRPGDEMFREGTAGKATGNHIHIEVAEGAQRTKHWDADLGVYRMKNEMNPVDAFFILEPFTTVVDTKGLKFKTTKTTRMETNMNDAEKLIAFADTQIGNTGAPYWQYFGYQDAWCSEFVSYCGYRCGFVPSKMPKADTCAKAMDFYKSRNQLHKKTDYTPKPGDIAYFGDKGMEHTAIVSRVQTGQITVIEGNAGDKDYRKSHVCETIYKLSNPWLWGYANPLTEGSPKQVDLTDELKKNHRNWVSGGIAGVNGTVYKVPKHSTLKLSIFHNSTYTLNSEWHVATGGKKAFKVSSATSTVSVTVLDEEHVLVKSQAGSPRTYWMYLE